MKAAAVILLALLGVPAAAQVRGSHTPGGCLDVSDARAATPITATGLLSRHVFPGPPNFKSVAHGDAAEPAYILLLPRPICVEDGGAFADAKVHFRQVQVWAKGDDPLVEKRLKAAVGHRATIVGAGMPAQTGHHHRPLLIEARSVSAR